jgi:hypothetical protein
VTGTHRSPRVTADAQSLVIAAGAPLAVASVSALPGRAGAFGILVTPLLLATGL